ncbi:hypothetical protein EDD86DRAFT_49393 [Gorgonomyces haynaldii]|nr:hypothetical protein EDD86DRAFT_49393 [Gorgonomyces haynaldii]
MQRCLQMLIDNVRINPELSRNMQTELFTRCVLNLIEPFIGSYGNNLVEYCTELILIGGETRKTGLFIVNVIHSYANARNLPTISSLRVLSSRMPFLQGSTAEAEELIVNLVKPLDDVPRKEIDMASQGRSEAFQASQLPTGSARSLV